MGRRNDTDMGGEDQVFRTTQWTKIFAANARGDPYWQEALADILGRYWKPVYCYLRRRGNTNERAKDLTQGFFCDVVLGRGLIGQAERTKGRFRTFLLTALDRYVTDFRRVETAKKRVPQGALLRLDAIDFDNVPDPKDCSSPDAAFNHLWASSLLDQVLTEVREQCAEKGMSTHWNVFSAKVLQPIMQNTEAPSYAELCTRRGLADTRKARNMVITVKRRIQAALKRHVRPLVDSDEEAEKEIDELIRVLSEPGAAL